jgi:hypothetical protein
MPKPLKAVKNVALNAVGRVNYAATKTGQQIAEGAKLTKDIAVNTTKAIPTAAKNTVMRPVASTKEAGKAIKNIAANGTVRGRDLARNGKAGVGIVAASLTATGLAIPVGAVLGAARANRKT